MQVSEEKISFSRIIEDDNILGKTTLVKIGHYFNRKVPFNTIL